MSKRESSEEELLNWLADNFDRDAVASLTDTDCLALYAAVAILRLYEVSPSERRDCLLSSFGVVVMRMQRTTRYLAYHAIAYVLEWSVRDSVWYRASLPIEQATGVCNEEPEPDATFRVTT